MKLALTGSWDQGAEMDANVLLWIGQVILAIAFAGVGYTHVFRFDQAAERPATRWMTAVGRPNMGVIGILELLGAVGLILPAATGVLPWLTPVAATLFAVLMLFALIFHVRRTGEGQNIVVNVVLGVVAALVAYGRFVSPRSRDVSYPPAGSADGLAVRTSSAAMRRDRRCLSPSTSE